MRKHAKAQPTTDQGASGKVKKKRQRKGSGSVRQRGNVWYISYTVGGRRVEVATTATTKRGATDLLADAIASAKAAYAQGESSAVAAPSSGPGATTSPHWLSDAKQLIEDDYMIKENRSTDRMRQAYSHLYDYFGEIPLADIGRKHIIGYIKARRDEALEAAKARAAKRAERAARSAARSAARGAAPGAGRGVAAEEQESEEGLGRGTIRCELAILRRMLNLAYDSDLIERVPRFPMPREARARQGFFETDEFNAVLEKMPEVFRPPLRFAMMTGWRFNTEVLALTWDHVDFRRGRILLSEHETKEKLDREFPFSVYPALGELLWKQRALTDAHQERNPGVRVNWVFHNHGARLPEDYHDLWDRACERAGHPDKLVHDLRRTAARNLSLAGVPTQTAMRLLGHQTPAMHTRYQIVAQPDLATGVAALAASDNALRPAAEAPTGAIQATVSPHDRKAPPTP